MGFDVNKLKKSPTKGAKRVQTEAEEDAELVKGRMSIIEESPREPVRDPAALRSSFGLQVSNEQWERLEALRIAYDASRGDICRKVLDLGLPLLERKYVRDTGREVPEFVPKPRL